MTANAIDVRDAVKRYRTRHVETTALSSVSFAVEKGEFVAVMGPSGCGKSTLLNTLGMLDSVDEGSYRLFGDEVTALGEARCAKLRRERLGFIFQNFNLVEHLNVRENVDLALQYAGRRGQARADRLSAVLDELGVGARADHYPAQLSGGQQQRVAIARAIATEPDLVLADEPTGNLDDANRRDVLDILSSLKDGGVTIIMVTHSHEDAAAADRVVTLRDGKVVTE